MGGVANFIGKFSFEPDKIQGKVWFVVLAIWLLVLVCAIGSIFAKPSHFTAKQRMFWLLMVVLLPGVGVLAYLPFSYKNEGFNFMSKPKPAKKSPSTIR